ncbi:DUF1127 domain-containing protein [Pseudomonas akapageensis]|uniref:DUF1127 domain-containing protein n=1 Tax=Pseudomonas akapageensis TaxID=2609961 RepID=UPI00140B71E2|nr:DUF1127 domain-containing protein [Pseudomonas akapageensis]
MKDHASFEVHAPATWVFRGLLGRGLAQVRRWRQLHCDRAELMRLSDAQLRDVGLSRLDVLREYRRPFWDDPIKK